MRSATLVAAVAAVIAVGAACQLDSLINPHEPSSPPPPAGAAAGVDSLMQLRSDWVTMIPLGGAAPEPSMVVSGVVRDTGSAPLRMEVEVRPVGTAFEGRATGTSDPTPSGARAYVPVNDLADNTGYHWQARLVTQTGSVTTWRPYGGNPETAADIQVSVPATARLGFRSQPGTTTAGEAIAPVQVAVVDGQGNTLTGFTGTVYLRIAPSTNAGGATLSGTSNINAVAGVATFSDLRITKAGSGYRLEATADGLAGSTSTSFGINPGIAHHPRFIIQPSNTGQNQPIAPAVRVAIEDVYDNVATSFTGIVYMEMGNGNAQLEPGGTQRAAAAGIATFEALRLNQVGVGFTLVTSAVAVHAATSAPFNVTP